MRCVDVNVLVYAHRPEAPDHERYLAWLDAARRADEPLGIPTLSLAGFLRIVTHPKVFRDPTPVRQALAFAEVLRKAPNHLEIGPGPRHWKLFADLCRTARARGNLIPDAYLAAMAIERDAVMITADRGMARFEGLRWRHPFDDTIPTGGTSEGPRLDEA
jgi:hypothetical protein